jgi:ketosteroid isomerase-like protein
MKMIDSEWAKRFSNKWIDAWNSHDLEIIFDLYDDEFEMSSPYIVSKMDIESGTLKGKTQIRPYWKKALAQTPPIGFVLNNVLVGVDTVIILYQSIGRKIVCETFTFNSQGKVISGVSQHAP